MSSVRNFLGRHSGRVVVLLYAIVWLAGAVLLASCSTVTADNFNQGDASEQRFRQDTAACEMVGDEHRSVDIALWGNPVSYNRLFDECMRSKGYTRKVKT